MYKVYKITNIINQKIYVGITKEQYLSHRFWSHANRKRSSGAYLHWAIKKHGVANFVIELLHDYATPDEAKQMEIKLIADWQLNRHRYPNGIGMNLTDGGDGSYGCRHSVESLAKMTGVNNHNHGLTGCKNPTSKAVRQLSLTNTLIQTFGSMHEAARHLRPGCTKKQQSSIASNIMTVIKGTSRSKQAYGYKWEYCLPE